MRNVEKESRDRPEASIFALRYVVARLISRVPWKENTFVREKKRDGNEKERMYTSSICRKHRESATSRVFREDQEDPVDW